MSQRQTQLNQINNVLDESIQLKEEANNLQTQGQQINQQQSNSSLNGKQSKIKFTSQSIKNSNGGAKQQYQKSLSRQLSRVNSIDDMSNSQAMNTNQDKNTQTHAFSLKALSKQKTLLEKQQKLMEELKKIKNVAGNKDISSSGLKKLKSQMVSRKGSIVQGKRGSKVMNPNNMAILLQKIQDEEDKQRQSFKYRFSQASERIKVKI